MYIIPTIPYSEVKYTYTNRCDLNVFISYIKSN